MVRITHSLRELAWAASHDAGMRSMRKAHRDKWNEDDYNAAVAEFDRLWPIEREIPNRSRSGGATPVPTGRKRVAGLGCGLRPKLFVVAR